MISPLQLVTDYCDYVWGGHRLHPAGQRAGEAWVIYEQDRIASGPYQGQTLAETAAQLGPRLLGRRVFERTGARFPLLVKLLDCADWLSLQVHPNDEQARRLEGPEHFGKTEAWHILDAEPGAALLFGLRPGTQPEALQAAVGSRALLDLVQRHNVRRGDTIFIRPGMIHALGPGLLIYEVQQTSTITYRVYDWDRPAAAGRKLHIEQSLEVLDPAAEASILPRPALGDGEAQPLVACPYFTLKALNGTNQPIAFDTGGETFHALTIIEGRGRAVGEGWEIPLQQFDSLVIPAECGAYQVVPDGALYALNAMVL